MDSFNLPESKNLHFHGFLGIQQIPNLVRIPISDSEAIVSSTASEADNGSSVPVPVPDTNGTTALKPECFQQTRISSVIVLVEAETQEAIDAAAAAAGMVEKFLQLVERTQVAATQGACNGTIRDENFYSLCGEEKLSCPYC
ncbi:hypothetical protein Bca101_026898 [Brassica carinata]